MLKTIPLLKYVVPFIAGIVLSNYTSIPFIFLVVVWLMLAMALGLGHNYLKHKVNRALHHWMAALLAPMFVISGIALANVYNTAKSSLHFKNTKAAYATVQVINFPEEKNRSIETKVSVLSVWEGRIAKPCIGDAILYLAKDSLSKKVRYGDVLYVNLQKIKPVKPPKHPTHFNLQRYYALQNISHTGFLKSKDWQIAGDNRANGLRTLAYTIRTELLHIFKSYFPNDDVRGLAEAVVFGYKEDLNPQWLSAFSKTGTIHVLAVSGLHVGIIYILLATVLQLSKSRGWKLYVKASIILLFLFAYSLLTGFSPSVSRASLMFGLVLVGRVFQRQSNIYNTLCFAAFTLLAINPFYIYSVGFQFSFLAVLGIVFYKDKIKALWPQKYWLSDKIATLLAVSIAAQLTTFPLGIYYFHQFPNYFMLSNLLVIPTITLVVYGGLAVAVLHYISAFAAKLIAAIVSSYISFIAYSVNAIQELPFAFFENVHITGIQMLAVFLFLFVLTWYTSSKKSIALVGLTVLAGLFIAEDYRLLKTRNQTNDRVLFSNYKGAALITRSGKETYVFSKGSYHPGETQYEFEVKPYLLKNRLLESVEYYPLEVTRLRSDLEGLFTMGDGMFMINGERYCWVDYTNKYIKQPVQIDYLFAEGRRSNTFYKAVLPKIRAKETFFTSRVKNKVEVKRRSRVVKTH
jgi:competence protein ComEC